MKTLRDLIAQEESPVGQQTEAEAHCTARLPGDAVEDHTLWTLTNPFMSRSWTELVELETSGVLEGDQQSRGLLRMAIDMKRLAHSGHLNRLAAPLGAKTEKNLEPLAKKAEKDDLSVEELEQLWD